MYYIGHDIIVNIELDSKPKGELIFKLLSPNNDNFSEINAKYIFIDIDNKIIIKAIIDSDICNEFGEYILNINYENKISINKKFDVAIPPNSYRAQLDTTILYGYISSISGKPSSAQNKRYLVTAKPKDLPILLDKNFISGEIIHTYSDLNGYFELVVAKGADIVFEIPDVPIRFHYLVPHDSQISIDVANIWKEMIYRRDKKNESNNLDSF